MALLHLMTYSKYLQKDVDITIYKPDQIDHEKPLHLMILLHGYMGGHTNYIRYTRIEKYLADKNIVVVMPDGNNSWYVNSENNYPYDSYLNKELHKIIYDTLNIKFKREYTYIAGLSMGGYGAIRSLLSYPNLYSKGGSFSGVLDLEKHLPRIRSSYVSTSSIFSEKPKKENLPFKLLKPNMDVDIYLSCGLKDSLLEDTKDFKKLLEINNIKHVCNLKEGNHDWDFWDSELRELIKYFEI